MPIKRNEIALSLGGKRSREPTGRSDAVNDVCEEAERPGRCGDYR